MNINLLTIERAKAAESINERVAYLDGLRGLAILLVIFYHYFVRFAFDERSIYPYSDTWASFPPFQFGYYGVHLFFGISGFVIALSLERSSSVADFALRRLARLWPTMLLCSVITYSVLSIWPLFWRQKFSNFIPSLTFVDGQVWNHLFPDLDAQWIDGAYWSLFVEVRFYVLAAIIYFYRPQSFETNLNCFVLLVVALHVTFLMLGLPYWADLVQMAFVASYLPWFLLGIAARHKLRRLYAKALNSLLVAIVCMVWLAVVSNDFLDLVAFAFVCFALFFSYKIELLNLILSSRLLTGIGVASYSLYLLHQNAGLTMISLISRGAGFSNASTVLIALVVMLLFVMLSRQVYEKWEGPLNKKIIKWGAAILSSTNGKVLK